MQPPFLEVSRASALLRSQAFISRWGQPLSVTVHSRGIPLPPPTFTRLAPTAAYTCQNRCEAAILEHKLDTGVHPYLYLSVLLTGEYAVPRHEAALYQCEPRTLVTPRWFGPLRCHTRWQPHKKSALFALTTHLTPEWLTACYDHYGAPDPGGGGHWLALRLLPRRRPCAVRLPDPLTLQVFIPLFQP